MRLRIALFSWLLVVTASLAAAAQAVTTFNVTNSGMTAYVINTAQNPTLSVTRGQTYTFQVNSPGHPFFIKTAQVTGTGSAYNIGVTNNGVASGAVTWQVAADAPPTLFYQCSIHAPMTGIIQVADAAVPAVGPFGIALLATLALGAGVIMMRRRAQFKLAP